MNKITSTIQDLTKAIDSKETRGEGGSDDVGAYDLMMKDKECLLSFEEPTRFIFSHFEGKDLWRLFLQQSAS